MDWASAWWTNLPISVVETRCWLRRFVAAGDVGGAMAAGEYGADGGFDGGVSCSSWRSGAGAWRR